MDSPTFEFDHWPLRDEWRVSVPLLLGLAAIAAMTGLTASNLLMAIGVFLSLMICTREMWLPSHVQMDRTGIRLYPPLGSPKWLPWPNVVLCEIHSRGYLLKTAVNHVPLSVNGLFIRSGRFHQELLEMIRYYHPECLGENDELDFDVELTGHDSLLVDPEPSTTELPSEEPDTESQRTPVSDEESVTEDSHTS